MEEKESDQVKKGQIKQKNPLKPYQKKREKFKAVEKMEPVEVERDPSQSEGPGKSQFTAALKHLIQKKMCKEHRKGHCNS